MASERGGDANYPSPAYAAYVVAILLVVGIASYLDRYLIALLVEPIKADLGITDTQVSLLQGAAFAVFYVLFGLPFGTLVDRWSRRNILAIGIALWSLMTVACGLADTYWELFIARAGVGIGEACLAPAAYSLIADYFAPHRRGKAMGVYNMSNYLGVGASLLIGGMVLRAIGPAATVDLGPFAGVTTWKAVFIMIGAPGLLLSLLLLTVREEERKGVVGAARPTFGDFLGHLGSARRAFASVYVCGALTAFVGLTFAAWGATLFIRNFGMKPAEAGLIVGPLTALCGAAGSVISGVLSDRISLSGRPGGRFVVYLVWWPICLVALGLLAISPSRDFALAALGLLTLGSGIGLANNQPALYDITPNQLRGRATSVMFIITGILGMGIAPTLTALVTDRVFHDPLALRQSVIVVLVPVALIGFSVALVGRQAYDRARLQNLA